MSNTSQKPLTLRDDYQFQEINNVFIPLSDGTELSAKLWLPKDAGANNKVPAILEFLPYRKNDLTCRDDEINFSFFAHNGYGGARVDHRGVGDSSGYAQDELHEIELSDCEQVIDYLANQDWCDGNVIMHGTSWGGFNSAAVAYRQPPALKAIVISCFTTDRYNNDVHYKGGTMLLGNYQWANYIGLRHTLPPDPAISDDWLEKWKTRLSGLPETASAWLEHQTRDDYWKHASVGEDFSRIKIPALILGGLNDGYTNAIYKMANGVECPTRAIIGPWGHEFPNTSAISPAWAYLPDALRWMDKWVKGIDNEQGDKDELIAYIAYMPKPRFDNVFDGRFVSLPNGFTGDNFSQKTYGLTKDGLSNTVDNTDEQLSICSPETTGFGCGEFLAYGSMADIPTDQRMDDANSLTFDTAPFEQDVEFLGEGELTITLSADKPIANAFVRLNVVHPTGEVRRLSYTPINLNHDASHETVSPLSAGEKRTFTVKMDMIGERIVAGAKLRLSISSAYFPMVWPNPEHTTITVHMAGSKLTLPVLKYADDYVDDLGENEGGKPTRRTSLSRGKYERNVAINTEDGTTTTTLISNTGKKQYDHKGFAFEINSTDIMSVHPTDPTSAQLTSDIYACWEKDDWQCETHSNHIYTCDKEYFYIDYNLQVKYNGDTIHQENHKKSFKRNGI